MPPKKKTAPPQELDIPVEVSPPLEAAGPGQLHPITVAFAVVKTPQGYVPMQLELDASGALLGYKPLHEPTCYEALAYEYLQGDVAFHYEALTIKRAQ